MLEIYTVIVILTIAGAALLYWRNQRKFARRNRQGIEQFGSYAEKFSAEVTDTVLSWTGYGFLLSGLFLLMIYDQSLLGWLALAVLVVMIVSPDHRRRR